MPSLGGQWRAQKILWRKLPCGSLYNFCEVEFNPGALTSLFSGTRGDLPLLNKDGDARFATLCDQKPRELAINRAQWQIWHCRSRGGAMASRARPYIRRSRPE